MFAISLKQAINLYLDNLSHRHFSNISLETFVPYNNSEVKNIEVRECGKRVGPEGRAIQLLYFFGSAWLVSRH